jgi:hypothetical protein
MLLQAFNSYLCMIHYMLHLEWLRQTDYTLNQSVTAAIALGKTRRSKLFPNSNFIKQLEEVASAAASS